MPTRADFQSGYASSGDARIYFEAAGVGPGLVFVHAGVSDSRMWEPQFDTFATKYRVVRYDHRGFGKSKMPAGPYALRDDLLSVVRQVGIAKATFVGCSMGGATVIDFALEHPEMVSALVLVGSGVTGLNDPSQLSADSLKHWAEFLTAARDRDVERARELEERSTGSTVSRATRRRSIRFIECGRGSFIARTSRSNIWRGRRSRSSRRLSAGWARLRRLLSS